MVGAGGAQPGPDRGALLGRRARETVAHAPAARVDVHLPAGLRIDEPEVAGGHELLLARVDDLDRHHAMARAQRAQRAFPVALAAEVGHDHDQPALAHQRGRAAERAAQRRRPRALLAVPAQLGEQRQQPEPALARAQDPRLGAAEGEHAEPVAAAGGDVADGERDALGDVGLAPIGGPEGHRGRDVEDEPRRQRALADVHAHVRLAQARGRVPVDVAHVVAGEVGPDHRQLGALADLRRQVLAGHQRFDPPHHRQVERAQDLRRDGARPGLVGGALRGGRDQPHGSRPPRARPKPAPARSRTSAPPANADVTWRFSVVLASRVPRLR